MFLFSYCLPVLLALLSFQRIHLLTIHPMYNSPILVVLVFNKSPGLIWSRMHYRFCDSPWYLENSFLILHFDKMSSGSFSSCFIAGLSNLCLIWFPGCSPHGDWSLNPGNKESLILISSSSRLKLFYSSSLMMFHFLMFSCNPVFVLSSWTFSSNTFKSLLLCTSNNFVILI